ncbi:YfhO family protein [Fructilactobacillus frigidiflavus]|uniref:YfhO family protein n=1 Tax=Fructilactobacillus frigidiflavus TaxID=3242688 RepID=UPI003758462D
MKKFFQSFKYYLAAFLLPMLVVVVAFGLRGIAPFGANNLLVSDLATQYLPFFEFLRSQLVNHTFSLYSFMLSLGDNAIPIYTYYLMSPLNLLVVLVKAADVPVLMEAIIILKIGLIGLSMEWFLKVKYHRQDVMQIIASVTYGLCGFVAMYFYDFMWLEALMMLPLVTLGIERLFYKGKWGGYVIALFAMIVLNYYMGYMMCIYSVIYFVYLVLLNRPRKTGFWKYVSQHKQMTIKYVTSSIIAAMLSGFMLIPTILGMLSTGKSSIDLWTFFPKFRFLPSAFVSLGVGATNFVGRLDHEPSLFVGSLAAMGLLIFWLSKRTNRQSKWASFWLVGAIFFGMLISTTDTIWHMFQMPAGFPFREVYMLSFVMIIFGYQAWLNGSFKDNRIVVRAGAILASLIMLGYGSAIVEIIASKRYHFHTPFYVANYWYIIPALCFVLATTLVIILANRFGKRVWWLMLALVCLEMGTNMWMALGGTQEYGNQAKFKQTFNQSAQIIKQQTAGQTEFGRAKVNNQLYSDSFNIIYNQYNNSLLYDFFGVNSYTSSLNVNTHDALANLGLYSRNERRISANGSTPVTEQLLGINQQITIGKDGSVKTTKNDDNTSLGYAVSNQIKHVKYDKTAVFDNLNTFVQKESNAKTNYFVANQINDVAVEANQNDYRYTVTMTPKISGIQYLDLATTSPNQELNVTVDGKKLATDYRQLGSEIIELGHFAKGQQIKVSFTSNSRILEMEPLFAGFREAEFAKFVQATKPYRLIVKNHEKLKYQGNQFTGTITTTKARPQVVISIPYDKGWQITDNGKNVQPQKVLNGLTGIELAPGKHRLQFTYHTPGLKIGLGMTILGMIGVLLQLIIFRRKRK